MKRPVWLFSMDTEQFRAPPTTTAALTAYFNAYGVSASRTTVDLVHFHDAGAIASWLAGWRETGLPAAQAALGAGLQPVFGFSCYTWNVAEFLELLRVLKSALPGGLFVAGGPHVQKAGDYLGSEPFDAIVIGEGEETFQALLDAEARSDWHHIAGLAFCDDGAVVQTAPRPRCVDLDRFPSPLEVLTLTDADGQPLYESIAWETSRGCPFRCAFCEWGTGAIGGKMHQWSMQRIRRDWTRIARAGIENLWLSDSNFGALREDGEKAQLIVELRGTLGFPRSFATSWSKKHSRRVQEIALLLHRHKLLPHYQLALQTLTPEALRLSNRQNMSANQYEPIAKSMSEQGVPIAAELIWGLPGDNLADFEANLDRLLAVFPNINIFGYTLLPGTEFYDRREEYRIEAIPVAGYGKARGEYVVGCHSFDREQGEEGYFLITAHMLMIHGHIMPLTARLLALTGTIRVPSLLRAVLRRLIREFGRQAPGFDATDRLRTYETRNALYLALLSDRETLFRTIASSIEEVLAEHLDGGMRLRQVSATAPRLEGPGLEGPGLEGPGLEGPGLEGPGLEGPGLEGPGLEGPGLEGPGLEGPGLEGPRLGPPGLAERVEKTLLLDAALCPRTGPETREVFSAEFDALGVYRSLSAMALPGDSCFASSACELLLLHPGGVGDILRDADGGSWLRGDLRPLAADFDAIAIA